MSTRPVVLALAIGSVSCGGLCLESCRTGVTIPNGSGGAAITGGPALLYAMYGTEKTPRGDESVTLFNALILKPEGSGAGYSGGSFSWECVRASETFVWEQGTDAPTLQLHYDGARKRLTIGDQDWPTSAANTFVISLDERWHPTVQALPLLLKLRPDEETLKRIQDALPADDRVRRLRVEAQSSTVPQNNQMQLTAPG
jgi:hypothetical protein